MAYIIMGLMDKRVVDYGSLYINTITHLSEDLESASYFIKHSPTKDDPYSYRVFELGKEIKVIDGTD